MRVTVTPVIGQPTHSRLDSLRGCHAITERAVTRAFNGPNEIGPAIADALHEIALMDQRIGRRLDDMCYVIQFRE